MTQYTIGEGPRQGGKGEETDGLDRMSYSGVMKKTKFEQKHFETYSSVMKRTKFE